jgi:hypothetical protein
VNPHSDTPWVEHGLWGWQTPDPTEWESKQALDSGALLVRPDQQVAWRSQTRSDDPLAELRRVLGQILAR